MILNINKLLLFQFHQMNKVWRRNFINTLHDISRNSESNFLDLISRLIKTLIRKEDFLLKIVQQRLNQQKDRSQALIKIDNLERTIKLEKILEDENGFLKNIQEFREETYCRTKAYLYTILARINQICQASRQKCLILKADFWVNQFKTIKQDIMDEYNGLIYRKEYDILPIIKKFVRFQNQSIFRLIPIKTNRNISTTKISLEPVGQVSNLQRIKTTHSQMSLKLSFSLQKQKSRVKKTSNAETQSKQKSQIKKLVTSKRLIISNRSQIKIKKPLIQTFQKVFSRNFTKLYKILDVKQIQVGQSFYRRMEMERDMRMRNQKLKLSAKDWQSQYQRIKNRVVPR